MMNAIEASERLRDLNEMIPYIEYATDNAEDDRAYGASCALRKLYEQLASERDELHAKLSEVSI